jgi:hypothetical protein
VRQLLFQFCLQSRAVVGALSRHAWEGTASLDLLLPSPERGARHVRTTTHIRAPRERQRARGVDREQKAYEEGRRPGLVLDQDWCIAKRAGNCRNRPDAVVIYTVVERGNARKNDDLGPYTTASKADNIRQPLALLFTALHFCSVVISCIRSSN